MKGNSEQLPPFVLSEAKSKDALFGDIDVVRVNVERGFDHYDDRLPGRAGTPAPYSTRWSLGGSERRYTAMAVRSSSVMCS